MRNTRLHLPGPWAVPLAEGLEIDLPAAAAQHVATVLRLRPGAPLTLFDGQGGEWAASVLATDRRGARARVGAHDPVERESPLAITLLQGLARGERMDQVVQKATELGVARILPIAAERSVVQLGEARAERRIAHWQAVAASACEQCGRNRVPEILPPLALAACGAAPLPALRWVLDPATGRALPEAVATAQTSTTGLREVALLVGPEGGLSDTELALAARLGFEPVRLGPRVLRTETAGLAALAALQALAGDFGARSATGN
jgi:16S rRNA (uracil1498-N3)-methyltransferase